MVEGKGRALFSPLFLIISILLANLCLILACGGGSGSVGDSYVGIRTKTDSEKTASGAQEFKILTTTVPEPVIGEQFSVTLFATGGTPPYTWSISEGTLPEGLTLDANTGIISGVPTTAIWPDNIIFKAIDSAGMHATCVISVGTTSTIVQYNSTELPEGTYGEQYSAQITVSGGLAPYSWEIVSGALHNGLSINASTGEITGIPTEGGGKSFYVITTDATGNRAEAAFFITINVLPVTITSSSMADGANNIPYYMTLSASGGIPPYTWSVAGGALPSGLSLNASTGAISGTPDSYGVTAVTLRATDSVGGSGTKAYNVTIGGIYITNATVLTDATNYTAYSETLVADGDPGPYTWSISAGALPSGLTLDANTGEIAGTPNVSGQGTFTVSVTNGTVTADREFFLQVLGDYWVSTNTDSPNCPSGRFGHTVVWTGETGNPAISNKLIVWGGQYHNSPPVPYNTGGIYDPETNTWTSTSTGPNCPEPRYLHTAVWTGDTGNPVTSYKMIIWSGLQTGVTNYNNGGIYDPDADSWTPTSILGDCPSIRNVATVVWTGDTGDAATSFRMIVWGGTPETNTGGIYNPANDSWTATSTVPNCPSARRYHSAIWTGNTGNAATSYRMIVWGGIGAGVNMNDGGIYNPANNSWAAISTGANCPSARRAFPLVWTGDTGNAATSYKMIVWGGFTNTGGTDTGGIYDPLSNTWAVTSTGANCPTARDVHTAIWTGNRMFVWGNAIQNGGMYDPEMDTWTPTSTGANCPLGRRWPQAVWTGSKIILWGGGIWSGGEYGLYNSGAIYTP